MNIPIVCARQQINPGDLVLADDDGVVIVRRDEASEVLEKSQKREQREAEVRVRYGSGELGLDINDMRPRLAEKGLKNLSGSSEE